MSPEQACRVVLNGRALDYRLRRSPRRRSIGLRINGEGLLITAPARASQRDIDEALRAKAEWIFRHLSQIDTLPRSRPLESGSTLHYLGQPYRLQVSRGPRGIRREDGCFHVSLPEAATPDALRRALERWYKAQAVAHFSPRVRHYAERLGVQTPLVALTSARTRWGSCNHKGEIRLHWRLMQAEPRVVDYVVAHELAHILELNHSPRFWAHVERVFPDWRTVRSLLKQDGGRLWQW